MNENEMKEKQVSNLYDDYKQIENGKDLKKRKLTLSDYHAIPKVLTDIQANGTAETFIKSVAEYFKNFGFDIKQKAVNYVISVN